MKKIVLAFLFLFLAGSAHAIETGLQGTDGVSLFPGNSDGAERIIIWNKNSGSSANSQINLQNDAMGNMSVGIGSSNLNVTGTEGINSGAIILETDANLMMGLLYANDIVWKNNPSDDGDLANLTESMRLDSISDLSVAGYFKLKTIGTLPDAADCNDASEYGRLIFYSNGGVDRIYVCNSTGWKYMPLT